MGNSFVTVHRSYDPIQVEILGDLLRDNDIQARVTGTRNAALVGVGQNALQVSIQVPNSQALAATEFLAAYFEQDGDELLKEAGAYDAAGDTEGHDQGAEIGGEESSDGPKSPLLAGGAVVAILGGSHYYAGRPWTAALLLVTQFYAIKMMLVEEWTALATGLTTFGIVILLDAVFGQLAVRAWNRGARQSLTGQMAFGLLFAAIAVSVGQWAGPHIPHPESAATDAPS